MVMTNRIPFFSMRLANAEVDLYAPIKRVLNSHHYILGIEVKGFEKEFAEYCGVTNAIGVANGTDALELSLRALGVKCGDKVIMAANAGFYASSATHSIGATPYYVDIDPYSHGLSSERLKEALKIRPSAIVLTHIYGYLGDVEAIVEISKQFNVPIIEDCAHAHGAMSNGKRAGSFGTLGCFSFYPTKNLGAIGDGGAVVTNDHSLAKKIRLLRQYGWNTKYCVELSGGRNSRLDEIQAAVLREKLPLLDGWNKERREIARIYNKAFSDLPVICPYSLNEDHVFHLYVVQVNNRDSFRKFIQNFEIMTEVHYPVPDHLQSVYPSEQGLASLPITERICQEIVTLPCYPGLGKENIERIIQAVRKYYS